MRSTQFEKKDTGPFGGGQLNGVKLETKAADDGSFEGYASIFDVEDRGGDTVVHGAFSESLARTPLNEIKMLWQHDSHKIIGFYTGLAEDSRGLHVKGQLLLDVQRGKEAHTLMKHDAIDSLSIGYRTIRSDTNEEDWTRRKLLEVDLWEISLVTFPMLHGAKVSAKNVPTTEKDLEIFLRDAGGFSRTQAKTLIANGFKAVRGLRDADLDGNECSALMAELQRARSAFSG